MSVELICEVSSNHGGDRGLMEAFIASYAETGADWVKFQSYQTRHLRPGDAQAEWLAKAELSDEDHYFLIETCQRHGTKFLTTVFTHDRVPFLASLGLEAIKIGSGEAGDEALAGAVLHAEFRRVFVSAGVQPWSWAYEGSWFPSRVYRLRCVSRYPTPLIACVQQRYGYGAEDGALGWSDHAIGIDACCAALMQGAMIIEKHVSLPEQTRDKRSWEATVDEFKELRAFADDNPERFIGRWQYAIT